MKEWLAALSENPTVALVKETFKEWHEDKTIQIAGALAFFTVLSLAPMLLILLSVVGIVTNQNSVQGEVYTRLADVVGESSADTIQTMVHNVNQSQSGGIAALVGAVILIFGAVNIFNQLQEALNVVWEVRVKETQGIMRTIKRRLWAALMLPLTGVIMLLGVALDTALSAAVQLFGDEIPHMFYVYVLQGIGFVVSAVVVTFLFAAIYKYLPDVKIDWDDVFVGAGVTAVLFSLGQFLLSIYLGRSSISSTYGAAGTLMVVLLWVYYSAQIFLFGAEFTQVYARRRGKKIEPESYAYHFSRTEPEAQSSSAA